METKHINSIKGILFIGLSIYLSFTFNNALSNLVSKSPMGWVSSSIILRLIISLSFARGLQLFVQNFVSIIKPIFIFLIGILLGFGVSFITPIYTTDYSEMNATDLQLDFDKLSLKTNNSILLNDKPIVIAFFSTNCPHCKTTSKLLGTSVNAGKSPKVYALFTGAKNDAENFIIENKGKNFKTILINDDAFFVKASGGAFPSIFLLNAKGKTLRHWSGELSYPALDFIISHQ